MSGQKLAEFNIPSILINMIIIVPKVAIIVK